MDSSEVFKAARDFLLTLKRKQLILAVETKDNYSFTNDIESDSYYSSEMGPGYKLKNYNNLEELLLDLRGRELRLITGYDYLEEEDVIHTVFNVGNK